MAGKVICAIPVQSIKLWIHKQFDGLRFDGLKKGLRVQVPTGDKILSKDALFPGTVKSQMKKRVTLHRCNAAESSLL